MSDEVRQAIKVARDLLDNHPGDRPAAAMVVRLLDATIADHPDQADDLINVKFEIGEKIYGLKLESYRRLEKK